MKKMIYILKYYGLWTIPFTYLGVSVLLRIYHQSVLNKDDIILAFVACLSLCLFIISRNVLRSGYERNPDIGWFTWLARPEETEAMTGKLKHSYPPVPEKLLYDKPTGFVFGQHHGKYVCLDPADEGHILVSAQSGSGKSAMFAITSILANKEVTK